VYNSDNCRPVDLSNWLFLLLLINLKAMKKLTLILLVICAFPFVSMSQKVKLNLYAAYVFDDQFDSYYDAYNYYEGTIEGGLQWGAGLGFMVNPYYQVELLYLRQDTYSPTRYAATYYGSGTEFTNFDLGINYILLGGMRTVSKPGSKVDGYAGLMAGVAFASIEATEDNTTYSDNTTKFAWGLKGGCDIWLTKAVAIKLQAQLLSASQSMGGSFYFGTGGSGAGVSSYSSIFQFSLGGGLAFRFGGGGSAAAK
jgi:hypothetical protein